MTNGGPINQGGLRIASNSSLGVSADGLGGNDRIYVYYNDELDGDVWMRLDGSSGDDTIGVSITLETGSSGDVLHSEMWGDTGSDDLNVVVYDNSSSANAVDVEVYGSSFQNWWWEAFDHDKGHFTANVDVIWGFEELY